MNAPIDWFTWVLRGSCLVFPLSFAFWWWKRNALSLDAFDELEMKARRSELATRKRVSAFDRMPTLEPVITYRSPTPSSKAPDPTYHPEPTWARRPEQDDPAPLFDARVNEVRMQNVDVIETPLGYDATPENDNAVRKQEAT